MELDDVVIVNLETGKARMSETATDDASRFPWREWLYEELTRVLEAMDRINGPGSAGPSDSGNEQDAEVLLDCCAEEPQTGGLFALSSRPDSLPTAPGLSPPLLPLSLSLQAQVDVLLASVMRDFFLRILGSYRYFIHNITDPSSGHCDDQNAFQVHSFLNFWLAEQQEPRPRCL
jgi:hypothetical protein